MTLAAQFTLNAAVVEVQYAKGMIFFDKCGSLMDRLGEALGPAFDTSIPNMVHGELVSSTERLMVRYGPKSFSVTQNWVRTPVRVELVAPLAWDHVVEVMGVHRTVTRLGVRFIFMWKVDDSAEAERRIADAQLFSESASWIEGFDKPKTRAWNVTTESKLGLVRVALNGAEAEIKTAALAADLVDVVPKHSIMLDLDYSPPTDGPFTLQKGQMKDFIRSSWERAKKSAEFVHKRLAEPKS